VEREEELSIICVKVVFKGSGRDQSTEMGSVHEAVVIDKCCKQISTLTTPICITTKPKNNGTVPTFRPLARASGAATF